MNTGFLFASGVLLLYVLSLFIKRNKKNKETTKQPSNNFLPINQNLTFEDIEPWIRSTEGRPSRTAVPDGKKKDGTQLFSIGLGHQIQPNEQYLMNATISDNQILEILKQDVAAIAKSLKKVILVPTNKNQLLALFSLRYNIGETAFNNSTLLKLLNQQKYSEAAGRFSEWRLSEGKINQGLVNRRERERQLFIKPI